MAYERTIWKNREVEKPRTFTKTENPDGTITLTPAEGNIIEQGTPIIADNMNNIEDGIEEALSIKQEVETHLAEYVIQTAEGTANAIVVNTGGDFKYTQGNRLSFKAISNSTGAVTVNIDEKGAKALKKLDGTNATVKSNKVYEIYYSASDDYFFLLARAEGNTIAENVLAGKTFSNDDDTGLIGTMPDKTGSNTTITPTTAQQAIPKGYYGGSVSDGKVAAIPSTYKRFNSGTTPIPYNTSTNISLRFSPQIVVVEYTWEHLKWEHIWYRKSDGTYHSMMVNQPGGTYDMSLTVSGTTLILTQRYASSPAISAYWKAYA